MRNLLSEIEGFEWDDGNLDKSRLKHGITTRESEQVFSNQPLIVVEDDLHSQYEQRYLAYGKTNDEKLLSVSFTIRENYIRVISARPMSTKEREIYAKSTQTYH